MSSIEVRTARSWADLNEALFHEALDPRLERYRSPFLFRGMDDASWKLQTTLMRLGGDFTQVERALLRNFRKYAPNAVVEQDSVWNWLALAQHHGLPTRVLDWTFSPLVAVHFAVWKPEHMAKDGAVWMVDARSVRAHFPPRIRAILQREYAAGLDVRMLASEIASLEQLDSLSNEPFALFFEPPSIDARIANQGGNLSVLSDPRLAFDDWLAERGVRAIKLVIPAALKWEVRDKLDHCNVNERVLFPGLDGLSEWLKRYYSPGARSAQQAKA